MMKSARRAKTRAPERTSKNEFRTEVGRVLRAARKHLGLTQTELSTQVGISQGFLSKVEHGEIEVDVGVGFALCSALNLSFSCLPGGCADFLAPFGTLPARSSAKLPKQYATGADLKIRWIQPLLQYQRKALGSRRFEDVISELDVPLDFLDVLDNEVNEQFLKDLLDRSGGPSVLGKIPHEYFGLHNHGLLRETYRTQRSAADRLVVRAKNEPLYESIFETKVSESANRVVLSFRFKNNGASGSRGLRDQLVRYQEQNLRGVLEGEAEVLVREKAPPQDGVWTYSIQKR